MVRMAGDQKPRNAIKTLMKRIKPPRRSEASRDPDAEFPPHGELKAAPDGGEYAYSS